MERYDIIVVGAGIVGATAALALAQQTSFKIALLDAKAISPSWDKDVIDYRVSAISLATQHIFQHLGVWDTIEAKRISPYQRMEVWDAEGKAELSFDCVSVGTNHLGSIIEDSVTRSSLLQAIAMYPAIHVIAPLTLVSYREAADYVELTSADGRIFQANLIIAADGGLSWVREAAAITLKSWHYEHTAIVAKVKTALPHAMTARQRFLPEGPLAFLPLSDQHTSSIVWSTSSAQADHLLSLDDSAFKDALASAFDYRLGDIQAVSTRHHFPLTMRHAKQYVRSRLALIGDAAHTIHPLAGQGVNLGLLDAACLIDVLTEACVKNRDIATLSVLRRYERWRKTDNVAMLGFVEAIKSFARLRRFGIQIASQFQMVRDFLTNYAIGHRGDMPTLARPLKPRVKKDTVCDFLP